MYSILCFSYLRIIIVWKKKKNKYVQVNVRNRFKLGVTGVLLLRYWSEGFGWEQVGNVLVEAEGVGIVDDES